MTEEEGRAPDHVATDLRAIKAAVLEELERGGRARKAVAETDAPSVVVTHVDASADAERRPAPKLRWEDMNDDERRAKKRADARRKANAKWESMTPAEQREKKRADARMKSQAVWDRMTPDEREAKKHADGIAKRARMASTHGATKESVKVGGDEHGA
jgi:hypothetical protein